MSTTTTTYSAEQHGEVIRSSRRDTRGLFGHALFITALCALTVLAAAQGRFAGFDWAGWMLAGALVATSARGLAASVTAWRDTRRIRKCSTCRGAEMDRLTAELRWNECGADGHQPATVEISAAGDMFGGRR